MSNKRQAIIDAANRVFYKEGFAEVGIDQITDEAEVALGTLYRHFGSRSGVLVAALRQRNREFLQVLQDTPTDRNGADYVLGLFDILGSWASQQGGNGCFFLRAASDYPNDTEVKNAALEHKSDYLRVIEERLRVGGWDADSTERMLPVIFVLLEGAVAAAFTLGDATAISTARKIAALMLTASETFYK